MQTPSSKAQGFQILRVIKSLVFAICLLGVYHFASAADNTTQADVATISKSDFKAGRYRAQGCTRCHGRTGMYNLARASNWEGSIAGFVVQQLTAFRDGQRVHAIMSNVSASLSDEDIALIAAWYEAVSKNP